MMRLQGAFRADFDSLKLKVDKNTGLRAAVVGLHYKVDQNEAKHLFGEEFAALALGSFYVSEGRTACRYRAMRPRLTFEFHAMHLCGQGPVQVQPIIRQVCPVKDEEAVVVDLQLPIILDDERLAGKLAMSLGEVVNIELNPIQERLPLGVAA